MLPDGLVRWASVPRPDWLIGSRRMVGAETRSSACWMSWTRRCRRTVAFGQGRLDRDVWEPVTGFRVARGLATAACRVDGSPWGEQVLRTAYAAANLLMTAIFR
jgi:hypothetical protein